MQQGESVAETDSPCCHLQQRASLEFCREAGALLETTASTGYLDGDRLRGKSLAYNANPPRGSECLRPREGMGDSMGTGTKIGIILILVLVIVVIANLLDSEVQRGPSAEQQVTGGVLGSTSPLQGSNLPGTTPGSVGTSGQGDAVLRDAQGKPVADSKTTAGSQPAVEGPSNVPLVDNVAVKPALARTDQVGLTPAAGVIRDDQGIDPVVVNRQGPDRGTASRVTPATKPVVPVMTRIEVQQGDSLWAIASRELGGGIHWPELLKVNPGLEELTILVPGRMLTIPNVQRSPTVRAVAATRPTVSTREGVRLYQIRDGDTLYDIARDELGNGGRWMEILKLNDGLDPNALPIGRKIFVPR